MSSERDATVDIWGARTPFSRDQEWPDRVDQFLTDTPDEWIQSACVLCSNGCALDIGVKRNKIVGVRGRSADHVNRGRLGQANGSSARLMQPLVRRHDTLEEATWDEAMSLIVERSKSLIEKYTPLSIGFYTSGQLMLEEYYTLAAIGKAGIGTPHMDGNTRLCTATAAAALKEHSAPMDNRHHCAISTARIAFFWSGIMLPRRTRYFGQGSWTAAAGRGRLP